jgi:Domain of unknown function (DUF222)
MSEEPSTGPAGTPAESRHHPLQTFAKRLSRALDDLAGVPALSLTAEETAEVVVELTTALSRLRAMQLAVLAHADRIDVAAALDATSTAAWLRSRIPLTAAGATRDVALAATLDRTSHCATAGALAHGRVLPEQAQVIVKAIDVLPSWVGEEERGRAEDHLVALAATHDAAALKVLGRRVLEVIDPEAADAELARRLEAEEAAAARVTSLTLLDDGHGTTHGRFRIPTLVGHMLRTALHALANPARPDPIPRTDRNGARRATPAVLGDAFTEYVARFPVDGLPQTGGVNATVVVTIPVETLEGRLRAADLLGTHHQLSPGAARKLACAAGVLPAVLGTDSRVLDLGRRARTATVSQRLALTVQQQGTCGVEHCDRPAAWADAHHWKQRWVDGGRTDLADLVLVCPRHHTLAHLPGRSLVPQPSGRHRILRT